MYVAYGKLLADGVGLPYRDYPHLQMPNLGLAYALIFRLSDHLLLSARLFSCLCAALSLSLIFYMVYDLFDKSSFWIKSGIAAGCVILILVNPLFWYTTGRAWNHDLAAFLAIAALFCHIKGFADPGRVKKWLFYSGLTLGLAVGTRLSYALLLLPFLISLSYFPLLTGESRAHLLYQSILGTLTGLLTPLIFFLVSPQRFVYYNYQYHKLNETYYRTMGYLQGMNIGGKLQYFIAVVLYDRINILLVSGFALLWGLWKISKTKINPDIAFPFNFILSVLSALLLAAFLPSPSWPQYFYPLVFFLVLGLAYLLFFLSFPAERLKWILSFFGLIVLFSAFQGLALYRPVSNLLDPEKWVGITTYRMGQKIKGMIKTGRILTLSPLFPLEGGLGIYKEFAASPFIWRSGALTDSERRKDLDLITEHELEAYLQLSPPQAILTGLEEDLEEILIQYARKQNYKATYLSKGLTLWVKK